MHEHNSQLAFYRTPPGAVKVGQTVQLRFFAPADAKAVFLCMENERYEMKKEWEMCGGQIFSAGLTIKETCYYTFYIEETSGGRFYGNASGLGGKGEIHCEVPYQITAYVPRPLPRAYAEGLVYQIFPDRFCPGGAREEIGIPRAWGEIPFYKAEQFGGAYTANDFFGGTLWGVAEKLPYLKKMGFTWIYLNPIFDTSSNHGYNTRDYRHIAAQLGGDAAFLHLVKRVKEEGMHLMLDGVFSHTGDDSLYFREAMENPASPYRAWYTFTDSPPFYAAWWGIPSLPNVQEEEPSYMEFMLGEDGVVRQWLRAGADGWRLDVADELPDGFLDGLREAAKTEKEDCVIIGEVWEDASNKISYGNRRRYLTGNQLDSVTNYPMRGAILDFVRGENDGTTFQKRVCSLVENYPPSALMGALSFLSGHDIPRVLTILGDAPWGRPRDEEAVYRLPPERWETAFSRLRLALVLLVTLPGVPCVFYGDEAGMEGYGDPFCRGTYPWGRENERVMTLYKEILSLRKTNRDFVYGALRFLTASERTIAFLRGDTAVFINAGIAEWHLSFAGEALAVPPWDYQIRKGAEKKNGESDGYIKGS